MTTRLSSVPSLAGAASSTGHGQSRRGCSTFFAIVLTSLLISSRGTFLLMATGDATGDGSSTSPPLLPSTWTTFHGCTARDNDEIFHEGGWRGGHNSRRTPSQRSYLREGLVKERVPGAGSAFVGHTYIAADPQHHFSILPPLHGCGTAATPGETSRLQDGGCDIATNAGFFVPPSNNHDHDTDEKNAGEHVYDCTGPLLSNGLWHHDDGRRQNVLFGIVHPEGDTALLRRTQHSVTIDTRSETCVQRGGGEDEERELLLEQRTSRTTIAVGYLPDDVVRSTKWSQLIMGVVWLVRNGEPFVEESMTYENFTAQRSGNPNWFRTLRAARLGLGVRKDGSLLLVAVDGSQPDWEGVTLDELASIMAELGAWQAINLDGGGSVSVFHGTDTVVNLPSDVCPNVTYPKFRCPRKVSSVVCLHAYRRLPGEREDDEHDVSQTLVPHETRRWSTKWKWGLLVAWFLYCLGVSACCWVSSPRREYTRIAATVHSDEDDGDRTSATVAALSPPPSLFPHNPPLQRAPREMEEELQTFPIAPQPVGTALGSGPVAAVGVVVAESETPQTDEGRSVRQGDAVSSIAAEVVVDDVVVHGDF